MYCPTCGHNIDDSSAFCSYCGAPVGGGAPGYTGEGYSQQQIPPATQDAYPGYHTQGKSKIAAGILGILLGALGVHNFYLGFYAKAVAQLLITVLSCGALAMISSIWGIVEGVMILTGGILYDADGRPLEQ